MRQVVPHAVWIGNARDSRDMSAVLATGVTAIVDLAMEEPPIQPPRDIVYCRFPLIDGEGNPPALLQTVVRTTASLIGASIPTLITCGGGMSRSPAIVAAALAIVNAVSLDQSLREVTGGGPHDVSPALWAEIQQALANTGATP